MAHQLHNDISQRLIGDGDAPFAPTEARSGVQRHASGENCQSFDPPVWRISMVKMQRQNLFKPGDKHAHPARETEAVSRPRVDYGARG
jgi:hypothetical protein